MIDFEKYKLGTSYYTAAAADILEKYKALYASLSSDIETSAQRSKDEAMKGVAAAEQAYCEGAEAVELSSRENERAQAERMANLGADASGGYAQTIESRRLSAQLNALGALSKGKMDAVAGIAEKIADIEADKTLKLSEAERDIVRKADDELTAMQKDRLSWAYKLYNKKLLTRAQLEQISGMKFKELRKIVIEWEKVGSTNW